MLIIYIVLMTLFLFGISVFVHEWGHFIVAKKCGLKVEVFSIGMGPALWKKEIGGVVYKIGAFPIGGYVSLPQLDPSGMQQLQGEFADGDSEPLPEIGPWKKIAVAFAGPICNIIFALFLGFIVTFSNQQKTPAIIGTIDTESAAYEIGLRENDQITAVNGHPIATWYDGQIEAVLVGNDFTIDLTVLRDGETLEVTIQANNPEEGLALIPGTTEFDPCVIKSVLSGSSADKAGLQSGDQITVLGEQHISSTIQFIELISELADQATPLQVLRDGEIVKLTITPKYNEEHERVLIGVDLSGGLITPWTLSGNPVEQIKSDATSIFRLLKALTTPSESKQAASGLGGPVAIFSMISVALKINILIAIGLIRFLNINLAVLNLLPIPVLDGGHICFALWEGITKRKVHPKVVTSLINIFAVLLIGAMIFLSWRDVDRTWGVSDKFKQDKSEVIAPAE